MEAGARGQRSHRLTMAAGQEARTGSRWQTALVALFAVVMWLSLAVFGHLLPPMHVVLGCLVVAMFLAVAVHEVGHTVAGTLFGFRCVLLSIWFLQVYRRSAGWGIRFALPRQYLGYAMVYARPGGDIRRRMLAMVAGGPIASLLAGAAAALWASPIERASSQWLFWLVLMFSVVTIVSGVASLLPIKGKHLPSDGARMRTLLQGGPEAERWCNLALLSGASMEGTRPRDLDPELIRLVTTLQDESLDALAAAGFHYNWAVDSGRLDEAAGLLAQILEKRHQWPEPLREVWLCEAAWFEAAFRKDLDAAMKWFQHPENRPSRLSAGARWKAQAAIAALKGRFDEAESTARNALRELERSPDLGVVKAIRESLARITARPPENARPTVLP